MAKTLLKVKNLCVNYFDKEVIHDVSFRIMPGEIIGIVGESGSGKSTIIKACMQLLENQGKITHGNIFYQDTCINDLCDEKMRRLRGIEMSMIFQDTSTFLCAIRTIREQLLEKVYQHENASAQEIEERAIELLKKMEFDDGKKILQSYPFELSGGMNQRVGIMMAMILKPKLIFADEPTSALDAITQLQVIKEMIKIRDQYGTSIVIVTHNIGIVEYMADKIIVMKDGRIIEAGKTKEVIQDPQQKYTQTLLQSVPHLKR